jgi:4'-phosphopantetheinyl transferase
VTALPQIGTVHVWLAGLGEFDGEPATPADKVRAGRFMQDDDRRRFLAGRVLARRVVGNYLGYSPAEVTFALTAFGKPYLCQRGGPDLRFNLSHSGDMVALAVSLDDEVGVDIETAAPDNADELVSIVLSELELYAFARLPLVQRPAAFLRCWTRKEALLKAAGTGLACDPRLLTVGWEENRSQVVAIPSHVTGFAVRDLAVLAGASGAVALAAPAMAVEIRRFSSPDRRARTMASPYRPPMASGRTTADARPPEMNP